MSDWQELGVMRAGFDTGRSPVVVRVSRNSKTGELSYEFGILRGGKVELLRYWREDRLYNLAMLLKAAAGLSLASTLSGMDVTPERLDRVVAQSGGALQLIDTWMTGEQEKAAKKNRRFGATIGELVGRSKP